MYKFNRNIIASSLRYQHKLVCKETNSPGCDSISFSFLSDLIRNNAQFFCHAIVFQFFRYKNHSSLKVRFFRGTQRICSSHYLFPRGIFLAGKNTGVSMSWLGNFVIDRGFAWELLTFSSISTRAGCRNSED